MNEEPKKADPPGQKCQVLKDGTTICKPIKPEGDKKKEGKAIRGKRIVLTIEAEDEVSPKAEGSE